MEYCVTVCHCSGLRWSVWRRFSDFLKLHEETRSVSQALFCNTLPGCFMFGYIGPKRH